MFIALLSTGKWKINLSSSHDGQSVKSSHLRSRCKYSHRYIISCKQRGGGGRWWRKKWRKAAAAYSARSPQTPTIHKTWRKADAIFLVPRLILMWKCRLVLERSWSPNVSPEHEINLCWYISVRCNPGNTRKRFGHRCGGWGSRVEQVRNFIYP